MGNGKWEMGNGKLKWEEKWSAFFWSEFWVILNYGFPVSVPIDQFNMEGKRAFIRFLTFKFFNH